MWTAQKECDVLRLFKWNPFGQFMGQGAEAFKILSLEPTCSAHLSYFANTSSLSPRQSVSRAHSSVTIYNRPYSLVRVSFEQPSYMRDMKIDLFDPKYMIYGISCLEVAFLSYFVMVYLTALSVDQTDHILIAFKYTWRVLSLGI
jgi:hypothetical protein